MTMLLQKSQNCKETSTIQSFSLQHGDSIPDSSADDRSIQVIATRLLTSHETEYNTESVKNESLTI